MFDADRQPLPEPLSLVVHHYWWVAWRRDRVTPFRAQVLADPVQHLTVEDAEGPMHGHPMPADLVHGLVTRVFTVDLPVAGRVAGTAFQPGGLAALLDTDVAALTGRVVRAQELFGREVSELARTVLAEPDETARAGLFTEYLTDLLRPQLERVTGDSGYRTVRQAVELMRSREQLRLAPVAEAVHVSPRTLQRLFSRYVGASPLWVLRRYRLRDAAAAIDAGLGQDLAALAASLGFSDQAHFSREFAAVIGATPSAYRRGPGHE